MFPSLFEVLKAVVLALLDHFAAGSEDPAKTDDK